MMAAFFVIPAALIKSQPDLSTTISICMTFVILLFVSGLSYKLIGGALAVGIPAAVIFISLIMQPDQKILDHYAWLRIMAWLNPTQYADLSLIHICNPPHRRSSYRNPV